VENRSDYVEKLGISKIRKLTPKSNFSQPVNYGIYL